jgi:GNAT superfamily N-acetyltransferase
MSTCGLTTRVHTDAVTIRPLGRADCGRFLELARDEGWSCDEAELEAFLRAFPEGCLVLDEGTLPIGFVMAYPHERSAWVGNLLVDAARRGRGLGTRLLDALLARLDSRIPTVYLSAVPQATALYRRYGFAELCAVSRFRFDALSGKVLAARGGEHVAGLLRLDERLWGDRRHELLTTLLGERTLLYDLEGDSYLSLGKVGDHVAIGPFELARPDWVAARRLLERALLAAGALAGEVPVLLDVPEPCAVVRKAAATLGGERIGGTTLMVRGKQVPVDLARIGALASMGSKG